MSFSTSLVCHKYSEVTIEYNRLWVTTRATEQPKT